MATNEAPSFDDLDSVEVSDDDNSNGWIDLEPGEEVTGDGNFWCAKTQTIMGPDRQICGSEYCLDQGRRCYERLA